MRAVRAATEVGTRYVNRPVYAILLLTVANRTTRNGGAKLWYVIVALRTRRKFRSYPIPPPLTIPK